MKKTTTITTQEPTKLAPIQSSDAAKVLLLPENDPTVALYEGIELYEANQHQQALGKLVYAAEHYHLHAIPYIDALVKRKDKPVTIDAETRQKLEFFSTWADWLTQTDIQYRQFFRASSMIVTLRLLKSKEDQKPATTTTKTKAKSKAKPKKSEYEKKLKEFLLDTTDCAHLMYHKALLLNSEPMLISSSDRVHLLATAYFAQCGKVPNNINYFSKQLCQLDYHRQHSQAFFATRVFNTSIQPQYLDFKAYYHYESARLGVPQAFNLVAETYFKDKTYEALPLIALGVLHRDARARCRLAGLVINGTRIQLPGFDTSPVTIIKLLRLNLANDYQIYHFPGTPAAALAADNITTSISYLTDITIESLSDTQILNDKEHLAYLENLFNQETDHSTKSSKAIANCLGTWYIHLCIACNDPQEKLRLHSIGLNYTRIAWGSSQKIDQLTKLLYITKEHYQLREKLSNFETMSQEDLLISLSSLIEKIESLADNDSVTKSHPSKERIKFIECCILIYVELMGGKRGNKRRTIAQYQKYLQMGVSAQLPHYMKDLAQHYLYGEYGFAQDAKKTRALILALPKSSLNSSSSAFRLLAYSYFLDSPADSQKGIAILIEQAKKHPVLYYTLGEIYGDGHIGVEENHDLAKKYYQLAIDNNIPAGNIGLGIFKMNDYDECQDQEQQLKLQREILEYFQKAADAGCPDGPYFLGKIHLYGMAGISQNLSVAKTHFEEAIRRNDHAYSKALLAMIAEGYQGEKEFPITYEFTKLESLKASGYIDENPSAMLEYGIISLNYNPITGIHYICKAAYFNDSDAKYFLATLQTFIDRKLFNIIPHFISKINKIDYRHLMQSTPPSHTQSFITLLHQLAVRCNYYIEREYTITEDYITDIIIDKFFTIDFDMDEIEEHIKTHFMPESMRKTLLLAENSLKHEKSGDTECKLATDKLLGPEKSSKQSLQKKLAHHNADGKISMHNFSTCLKALITSGITLTGEDKKAVQAAAHIHPPHGRGDKNPHQDLEGGRKNTVRFAFDAIQRNLMDPSQNGSVPNNNNNDGDDSFDTDSDGEENLTEVRGGKSVNHP